MIDNTVSCIYRCFDTPKNIEINGKTFKNIYDLETTHFTENGKDAALSTLYTDNAKLSVYENDGKVRSVNTYYSRPVTKTIGNRTYNSITTEFRNFETGITKYENISKNYLYTAINVNKNGEVISIDEPVAVKVSRKTSEIFKKIFKIVK